VRSDDIFRRVGPYAGMAGGLLLFAAAGLLLVTGHVNPALIWLLVAAGLLLVFYVAADPARVMQALSGRQARYGSNAGLMTVAFVGIFIIFNFLGVQRNQHWDLTSNGVNTLSTVTTKLLATVKQPVQIIAFYAKDPNSPGGQGRSDAQKLLEQYTAASRNLSVTFVDPDANPGEAQQYKITVVPSIVVTSNGKQEIVQTLQTPSEQDISAAIQKVVSGKTPKVYFLQGHGEPDLQATSGPSFSAFAASLQRNNLEAAPLVLLASGTVPTDADAVVEASPATAYSPQDQKAILDYLARGGRLLVLSGPFPQVDLNWLTKPYGVAVDGGLVADFSSNVSSIGANAVVIQKYEVTQMTPNGLPPALYQDTTALTASSPAPAGVTVSAVARTSSDSFELTDPKAAKVDPSKDKRGPFTIVASAEKVGAPPATPGPAASSATPAPSATSVPTAQPTRLVVFGDTKFITDPNLMGSPQIAEANSEAAIAALKWLTTQPNGVIIPANTGPNRSLGTLVGWQTNVLIFGNAIFVPAIILLAGLAVWMRRR